MVTFDYKDLGLASYLIQNGGIYIGYNIKYSNKFNEYKLYIMIKDDKEKMINLRKFYEENKIKINKDVNIKNIIMELRDKIENENELYEGLLSTLFGGLKCYSKRIGKISNVKTQVY